MERKFKKGLFLLKADIAEKQEIIELFKEFKNFKDGYFAFSNCEKRAKDIKTDFDALLNGRVENIVGVEGYLMEAGLWKNDEANFYELYIERTDKGFHYSYFHLSTQQNNNYGKSYDLCFYRYVEKIFNLPQNRTFQKGELKTIEVIIPEKRINIFITA